MRVVILMTLASVSVLAEIANVKIAGVTNTQAVVRYQAPTAAPCQVAVSEAADFSALVNDVNPALYPGADLDSRPGSLTDGQSRALVIGRRILDTAADGSVYSRALQASTRHYVRIVCGQEQAVVTFETRPVPLGATYADPIPAHPTLAGAAMRITRNMTNRSTTYIDPQTGVLLKYMTMPGDQPESGGTNVSFQATGLGSNWTSPGGILSSGGDSAGYDGSACGASCDWLRLAWNQTNFYPTLSLDSLTLRLTGSGTSPDPEHRAVQACVSLNGTDCDPLGVTQELILPSSRGAVTAGDAAAVDTWRGVNRLSLSEIAAAGGLRILIRKKTGSGSISIDVANFDFRQSHGANTSSGGNTERCSLLQDQEGWYLCTAFAGGVPLWLYRVHGDSGEVRLLGNFPTISVPGIGGTVCSQDHSIWDASVPNRMYCQYAHILYQMDYGGDGNAKNPPHTAEFRTSMMADSLSARVKNFVDQNISHYSNPFDASRFNCVLAGTKNAYLALVCRRGSQDTYGWLAVMNTFGTVIAAMEYHSQPTSRWCGIHSYEEIGHQNVFHTTTQNLIYSITGGGPYSTTLTEAISAGQTSFLVAGEPLSNTADNFLMNAAPGDVFRIDGEFVRITAKSGYSWSVQRGVLGSVPAAHANGAGVQARCASAPGNWMQGVTAMHPTWRFLDDPYGEDRTGTHIWVNAYVGHATARKNVIVNNSAAAETSEGVDLIYSAKNPAYTIRASDSPPFAGKDSGSPGLTYQTHPTWHNVNQVGFDRKFWLDVRPFIGGNAVSIQTPTCDPNRPNYPQAGGCAAARVPGTAAVYKWTSAGALNRDGVNSKHFAVFATAGQGNILRNLSAPQSVISDATPYTWCQAMAAGECVADSVKGDIYASVPNLTFFYCTGGETFRGRNDLCITDMMAHGSSLVQYGAYPQTGGYEYSRTLVRDAAGYAGRNMSAFTNAKALSNGRWALTTAANGRQDIALVKLPPAVKDSFDRSTFQPVPVAIGSDVAGTVDAVVEFGYDETLRCSPNRNETCIAHKADIDTAEPYSYAVEGVGGTEAGIAGVLCNEGCTITIPALSDRVVYYRVKYRDGAGNILATGPLHIRTTPLGRP